MSSELALAGCLTTLCLRHRILEQAEAAGQGLSLEPITSSEIPSGFDVGQIRAVGPAAIATFGSVGCISPVLAGYSTAVPYYSFGVAIDENRPVFGEGHNGEAPMQFTVDPALPAGLVLDPETGCITGTPEVEEDVINREHTVTATNAGGMSSCTLSLSIGVSSSEEEDMGFGRLL